MLKIILSRQTNYQHIREKAILFDSMSSASNIYNTRGGEKTSISKLIFLLNSLHESDARLLTLPHKYLRLCLDVTITSIPLRKNTY